MSVAAACLLPGVDVLSGGGTDGGAVDVGRDSPIDAGDASTCDATFCDDFDRGPLGATWTEVHGVDAGFLTLGAPAASPPNALLVTLPDGGAGKREAMLIKDLPKGSSLRCSFSVLGEALPAANGAGDALIFYYGGSGAFVDTEVLMSMSKAGITVRQDVGRPDGGCDCPGFETALLPFATGIFTRLAMEIDFSTVRAFVNDVEVASHAIVGAGPSPVRVSFGMDRPSTATRVRFDDFTCVVKP